MTDTQHEARDAAYVELVADLREQAAEAVGQIGEPGTWPADLRRESAAFAMVADYVEREFLGHPVPGTHGHVRV